MENENNSKEVKGNETNSKEVKANFFKNLSKPARIGIIAGAAALVLVIAIVIGLAAAGGKNKNDGNKAEGGCNHVYEEIIASAPTCDSHGSMMKSCTLCGDKEFITLDPTEHSFTTESEQKPTCIFGGYKNEICTKCEYKQHESYDAIGHSYAYRVTTEPTEERGGYYEYYCTNDGCTGNGSYDMPPLTDSAYVKETIDEDNFKYTYTLSDGGKVSFTVSNFKFATFDLGEFSPFNFPVYELVGYTGEKTELVLPATYNGYPVVSIRNGAFEGNENIVSVAIPEPTFTYTADDIKDDYINDFLESAEPADDGKFYLGYSDIGSYTFKGCSELTTVSLSAEISSIGYETFKNCEKLSSINLSHVIYVDYEAFLNCSSLAEVNLANTMYILQNAFEGCTSLESVTLGSSLEVIGAYAFKNCTALTEFVIPDSVTAVESAILEGCTGIKSLTLPKLYWNKLASLFSGYLYGGIEIGSYYDASGEYVPAIDLVTVTQQTEIPDSAFENCTKIKAISLPDGVTSIGKYAFYNCSSLEGFKIPDSVTSIGRSAFDGVDPFKCTQDFDNKTYYIGSKTNPYFYLLTVDYVASGEIYIQDGCKHVAYNAFYYTSSDDITAIHIPASVEYLGVIKNINGVSYNSRLDLYYAGTAERFTELSFAASGWQSIHLYTPSSSGYSEVTELIISDKVTEIVSGTYTTYGNFTNLVSIRIPASVKKIGNWAFSGSTITSVYYDGTIADWCAIDFANFSSNPMSVAENFYIKNGSDWTELSAITIPDGVTVVNQYAFYGFSDITEIFVPASVEEIYVSAYAGCVNLEAIYYYGTAEEWEEICYQTSSSDDDSVTKCFYSENQPSLEDYLAGLDRTLWHYDENGNPEAWSAKRGNTVNGKTYAYTDSSVSVSDEYWFMIESLKQQGMLDMLEDDTLIEIASVSNTKSELEAGLKSYYAATAEGLVLSFENGIMITTQKGESASLEYLELDGVIYYILTGGEAFSIVSGGASLEEYIILEYITVTHTYVAN